MPVSNFTPPVLLRAILHPHRTPKFLASLLTFSGSLHALAAAAATVPAM